MNFRVMSGTHHGMEYHYFDILGHRALLINYPYIGWINHG